MEVSDRERRDTGEVVEALSLSACAVLKKTEIDQFDSLSMSVFIFSTIFQIFKTKI